MSTDYIWQLEMQRLKEEIETLAEDEDAYEISGEKVNNLLASLRTSDVDFESALKQILELLQKVSKQHHKLIIVRDIYRRTSGDKKVLHDAAEVAYRKISSRDYE